MAISTHRIALITGGNRGIGREIVRQLAQHGMHVVLGARDAAKGEAVAAAFAKDGLDVTFVPLDVTDGASVKAAVAAVKSKHRRIDVLVNNAGVYLDKLAPSGASLFTVDPEILVKTHEINVVGPLRMIQAVVPVMRAHGYGRIVNVSTLMAQFASIGAGATGYRSSKAALNALTKIASIELGRENIKINAMHPGWVKTDMGGPSAPKTVEEAADTAVFLATLPDDGPTGGFFHERKPIAW